MEERIFRSSINFFSGILLTILGIFLIGLGLYILFFDPLEIIQILITLLLIAMGICSFWILYDTKYVFKNTTFHYYSGPIRGTIDVNSIRKIEHQKGWYQKSVLKPALDYNGLYIYYNKFDDLYISPKEKEEFVNYLLKINPKIEIN